MEESGIVLFSGRKGPLRRAHAIGTVRDAVEIAAIIAAGVWAFYVFAYENRIKPSMANPEVNVSASMQRLGQHKDLVGVGVHVRIQNVGTVKAHFLGIALNVYGERVVQSLPHGNRTRNGTEYNFSGFYHTISQVPVYSYAYVTKLGDPSTTQDTELDPGTSIENYRTFYVPKGRFDSLTLGVELPYTKFDDTAIPTHLVVTSDGAAKVVTRLSPRVNQYNIVPVTTLDMR